MFDRIFDRKETGGVEEERTMRTLTKVKISGLLGAIGLIVWAIGRLGYFSLMTNSFLRNSGITLYTFGVVGFFCFFTSFSTQHEEFNRINVGLAGATIGIVIFFVGYILATPVSYFFPIRYFLIVTGLAIFAGYAFYLGFLGYKSIAVLYANEEY
jgi:hypothetical protein